MRSKLKRRNVTLIIMTPVFVILWALSTEAVYRYLFPIASAGGGAGDSCAFILEPVDKERHLPALLVFGRKLASENVTLVHKSNREAVKSLLDEFFEREVNLKYEALGGDWRTKLGNCPLIYSPESYCRVSSVPNRVTLVRSSGAFKWLPSAQWLSTNLQAISVCAEGKS